MVPQPVKLSIPLNTPPIFAAGAELKNTFCLTRANNAYPSVYIGDLDNSEAMAFYQESFSLNKKFLDVKPAIIAHDIHPDYQSTVFASGLLAKNSRLKAVPVQHHHAHIASVMAEHRLVPPLTGIAFDGTGLGFDNTVWGGECFTVDKAGEFIRRAHWGYLALPGGDVASKEIWRMAVSLLTQSGISKMPAHLKIFPARKILKMIKREINSPKCCSVGRLFDAVAAIINLRTECTFEAQAAMELEALAVDTPTKKGYTFALQGGEIPVEPVIRAVYKDFCSGVPAFEISARFHLTLSRIVLMLAKRFKNKTVALSGGVFQNRFLLGMAEQQLLMAGFKVYYNNTVPINDGGISLGQAYIAATNENRKSRIEK
jgi:hydrogenase maturation protein HypF